MKAFGRFDLLFGVVTVALLALVATLLFGRAFSDTQFWLQCATLLGVVSIVSYLRKPLSALRLAPRMIAWFSVGFTAAAFFAHASSLEFAAASGSAFGLLLALLDFIIQKFGHGDVAEDR